MRIEQWEKEKRRLKGAVTRARKHAAACSTLAEKIEAKIAVRVAEDALHAHKIRYFELVTK